MKQCTVPQWSRYLQKVKLVPTMYSSSFFFTDNDSSNLRTTCKNDNHIQTSCTVQHFGSSSVSLYNLLFCFACQYYIPFFSGQQQARNQQRENKQKPNKHYKRYALYLFKFFLYKTELNVSLLLIVLV